MRILAIDPGNIESGYAVIEMPEFSLIDFGKVKNREIIELICELVPFDGDSYVDEVVIEMVESQGMAVGKDVFETCVWIGRFTQVMEGNVAYVYRKEEKMALCGSMKAKDSNIKQALIDRYAKFDFKTGKGKKKNPDTFYGVSKDAWQAIAVGVTYWETRMQGGTFDEP